MMEGAGVLDGTPTVASALYLFLLRYLLLPLTDDMISVQLRLNLQARSKSAGEKRRRAVLKQESRVASFPRDLSQLGVVSPPVLPQQLFCQLGIKSRCGLLL